jgi:hypothetical protein
MVAFGDKADKRDACRLPIIETRSKYSRVRAGEALLEMDSGRGVIL